MTKSVKCTENMPYVDWQCPTLQQSCYLSIFVISRRKIKIHWQKKYLFKQILSYYPVLLVRDFGQVGLHEEWNHHWVCCYSPPVDINVFSWPILMYSEFVVGCVRSCKFVCKWKGWRNWWWWVSQNVFVCDTVPLS